MKDTVAHLQALYGTTMFYQANVTRAQAKKAAETTNQPAAAPDTAIVNQQPIADSIAPIPSSMAIPTSDIFMDSDEEDIPLDDLPREKGEAEEIMQEIMQEIKAGADTWAATFLQRCANGDKHDPAMAKLINNQQTKPDGPDKWTYHRGLWLSKGALVIPNHDSLRTDCISQHHDPPHRGHQGILRTKKAIERFYWWPGSRSGRRKVYPDM